MGLIIRLSRCIYIYVHSPWIAAGNATKRPAAALSGATDAANGTGTAVAAGGPGMLSGRPMAGAFPVYRELAGIANSIGQPQLLVSRRAVLADDPCLLNVFR